MKHESPACAQNRTDDELYNSEFLIRYIASVSSGRHFFVTHETYRKKL